MNKKSFSAGSAARALLSARIISVGTQAIGIIVLSRLLTPVDFGIVAMVSGIMVIGNLLGDLGTSLAAIRIPQLSREQWSGLFWFNTGIGLAIGGLIALLSPWISSILNDPSVRIFLIALTPTFVFNGSAAQYRVQLNRDGRFAALATIESVAPAVGLLVAVSFAIVNPSPWPLIAQGLVASGTLLVLATLVVRQAPGWPKLGAGIRHLVTLGGALSATQVLQGLVDSAAPILLGRALGDIAAGNFSRGFSFTMMPHRQLATTLTRVAIPKLAQAETPEILHTRIRAARAAYGYSVGLISALVGGLSIPLVTLLLGVQWEGETATVVSILSIGMMLQTVGYVLYWALVAVGNVKLFAKLEIPNLIVMLFLLATLSNHGPVAVAGIFAFGGLVRAILYLLFATRSLLYSRREYLAIIAPNITLMVLVYLSCQVVSKLVVSGSTGIVANAVAILVGFIWTIFLIAILSRIFPTMKEELKTTIAVASSIVGFRHLRNAILRG